MKFTDIHTKKSIELPDNADGFAQDDALESLAFDGLDENVDKEEWAFVRAVLDEPNLDSQVLKQALGIVIAA